MRDAVSAVISIVMIVPAANPLSLLHPPVEGEGAASALLHTGRWDCRHPGRKRAAILEPGAAVAAAALRRCCGLGPGACGCPARAPLSAPCSGFGRGEPERGGGPRAATGRGERTPGLRRGLGRASAPPEPARAGSRGHRTARPRPACRFGAQNPRSVTAGRPGLRAGVVLRPAWAFGRPHGRLLREGLLLVAHPRACRRSRQSWCVSWEPALGCGRCR